MFQTIQITPSKLPLSPIDHNTPSMNKMRNCRFSDQKFYTPHSLKDQNNRANVSQQKNHLKLSDLHSGLKSILQENNFSNSKFFTQNQSPNFNDRIHFGYQVEEDLESVQKIRSTQEAQQLIEINALKLNLNLNGVSVVFQDVVKHFYIFHNIKLLCAYQMDNNFSQDLVNLIHLENSSSLTLVITNHIKMPSTRTITHIQQLPEIKTGLVTITYQNLLLNSNNLNEEIINGHQSLRNVIYLYEQDKFVLNIMLNIRRRVSQLILLNRILPIHLIKEFKNWIDIDTNYFGPLIEFSKAAPNQVNQSFFKSKEIEYYRPNYKLKPTLFLSRNDSSKEDMVAKIVKDLTNQKISSIIIKVDSVEEINQLDIFLTKLEYQVYTAASYKQGKSKKLVQFFNLGVEILLTQTLGNLHHNILKDCSVLVHAQMPKSIEQFMNDGFHLEEKGSQIVVVSEKDYLQYRNEIASNRLDSEVVAETIRELLSLENNFESLFKFQLDRKFKKTVSLERLQAQVGCSETEVKKLVHLLQTNKLVEIIRIIPYQCNYQYNYQKLYMRDSCLAFQKSVVQSSRKCLQHSDAQADSESYELNLMEFSQETNASIGEVINILQRNENFERLQFENWQIEYNILSDDKQQQKIDYVKKENSIFQIIKKLQLINQHEQEDLDLFYCYAVKQSKSSNLEKSLVFLKEYYGSEHRVLNCEYFNEIKSLLPKCDDLNSIKSKNNLQNDIKV